MRKLSKCFVCQVQASTVAVVGHQLCAICAEKVCHSPLAAGATIAALRYRELEVK